MNTKVLEYMIAIAEEKSISRAAERFYLSQPVLSRHLKKVEEEMGTQLFMRGPGGLSLTDAGIIFINNAQAILHTEKQLEEKLEAMRRSQRDSLTLLMEPHYINFFLETILPLFRQEYPDFSIYVSAQEADVSKSRLKDGEADLAVFTSRIFQDEHLELLPLSSDELLLVLLKEDPACRLLEQEKPSRLALESHLFCLHSRGTSMRQMEEEWLDSEGILPHSVIESDSFPYTLRWIYQKKCCAFIPKHRLAREASPALSAFEAKPPCVFHQVLAYSKSASFKRPAHDLIRMISDHFTAFPRYAEGPEKKYNF